MRIASRKQMGGALAALLLSIQLSCRSDSSSPVPISTVTLTPATGSVNVGSTLSLTALAQDAKGNELTGRPFTFTSSDTNMATVSTTGVVTGIFAEIPQQVPLGRAQVAAQTLQ